MKTFAMRQKDQGRTDLQASVGASVGRTSAVFKSKASSYRWRPQSDIIWQVPTCQRQSWIHFGLREAERIIEGRPGAPWLGDSRGEGSWWPRHKKQPLAVGTFKQCNNFRRLFTIKTNHADRQASHDHQVEKKKLSHSSRNLNKNTFDLFGKHERSILFH